MMIMMLSKARFLAARGLQQASRAQLKPLPRVGPEVAGVQQQVQQHRSNNSPLPWEVRGRHGVPIRLFAKEIDDKTMQQLLNVAATPFVHSFVAAMPDVHLGQGATVGSVFASRDAVAPNAVGVDIGCGMCAAPLINLSRYAVSEKELVSIQRKIKARIPTGFSSYNSPPSYADDVEKRLFSQFPTSKWMKELWSTRHRRQIGTLGGGNHFIELCYDEMDRIWMCLHSGSRKLGLTTAEHYNELARQQTGTNDSDLYFLSIPSDEGQQYLQDMQFCQGYAMENRRAMIRSFAKIVQEETQALPNWDLMVNIHHNYCSCETCRFQDSPEGVWREEKLWVTRKGATSAKEGEMGIIPGSMGTGSYITRGKGNPISWQSCSHGAGRRLSRTQARNLVHQKEFEDAMEGVICDTVEAVKDEAPQAYKNLAEVIANQETLVDVVHRLKPLVNVKGF